MRKLIIPIAILMASCGNGGYQQKTIITSNPNYDIQLLFEHEGCKVYEFQDGGYSHYFTDCRGSVSSEYKSGKVTHIDEIQTVCP